MFDDNRDSKDDFEEGEVRKAYYTLTPYGPLLLEVNENKAGVERKSSILM